MPSIEFFSHWIHHQKMVLEAHENFQKRTWRNKTAIVTPFDPLTLSVPLKKGKNNNTPIREVQVSYDEHWHRIHFNSIRTAYGKTPFFEEMETDLKEILFTQPKFLWDLNLTLITFFTSLLKGNWKLEFSKSYVTQYPEQVIDLRKGIPAGVNSFDQIIFPEYDQVQRIHKKHMPNLSILDVICHLGPDTNQYLLQYAQPLYRIT